MILLVYFVTKKTAFFIFHDGFTGGFETLLNKFQIQSEWLSSVPYFGSSIVISSLKNPIVLIGFIVIVIYMIRMWSNQNWDQIAFGKPLRIFVVMICAVVAWTCALYDFNYYFNQWHLLDRGILIVLVGLVAWRPVFIPLFLGIALLMLSQFSYPFYVSIIDKELLFNVLILVWGYILLHKWFKPKAIHLLLLLLCLIGSNYFYAAVTKIYISPNFYDWVTENELWMHALFSQHNGWLGFLDQDVSEKLLSTARQWNITLLTISLLIELLSIVLLVYNRRWAIFCLISFNLLHIGIFAESGIFFWKWIIVNSLVIFLLTRVSLEEARILFKRKYYWMSVFLIIGGIIYFKPVKLGWWDTRTHELYSIEVELDSGDVFPLRMNDMSPYDITFTFARFSFLNPHKTLLANAHVSQDYDLYQQIRSTDKAGLLKLTEERASRYNSLEAQKFDQFIQSSFANINDRILNSLQRWSLSAPDHIYTKYFSRNQDFFQFHRPVKKIHVRYQQLFYFRGKVEFIRDDVIRTIEIPESLENK